MLKLCAGSHLSYQFEEAWFCLKYKAQTHPENDISSVSTLLGYVGDLHSFDPANMTWSLLSTAPGGSLSPPPARGYHGFTSAGGMLYVHGGYGDNGMDMRDVGGWLSPVLKTYDS